MKTIKFIRFTVFILQATDNSVELHRSIFIFVLVIADGNYQFSHIFLSAGFLLFCKSY